MGRTQKSQGLAPPAVRKDLRAKQARHIINKVIPAILASNARARKGSEDSELVVDPQASTNRTHPEQKGARKEEANGADGPPQYIKRKGQGRRKANTGPQDDAESIEKPSTRKGKKRMPSLSEATSHLSIHPPSPPSKPTIRIITTDTLTATQFFTPLPKPPKNSSNPCILNMASPLRPGGGVLTGATSQEEFLCSRTTLLPSLKESFYRLPEYGGIYTRDVLVFRNALPLSDSAGELGPTERYYVDVVSSGMLRFPELEGGEEEERCLARKDRAVVERKMRAVLRMARERGVRRLVLGAWGCGAYGNPVRDVAEAWARVINGEDVGGRKGKAAGTVESWGGIAEIIFAISNAKMAAEFAQAFTPDVTVEVGPGAHEENEEGEEGDSVAEELRVKIKEMEGQIGSVWNPELKLRMGAILDGLKAQLRDREGGDEDIHGGVEEEDDEDGNGIAAEHGEREESSDEEDGEDTETDSRESEDDSDGGGLNLHIAR